MRASGLVAAIVLSACGDVPPPPGTREPAEPGPAAPVVTPAIPTPAVVAEPACRADADCRLAVAWCPSQLHAVPAGARPIRPGYPPAYRCPHLDQAAVEPACIDGRCVLRELDAPELRTCTASDECILAPRGCHTTPIRADAREAFVDLVGGAVCARSIEEAPAVCTLGVCVDPAWLSE